ncbi:MAG: flagellar assembly protein FliH [Planctomycetaceae bacterium]|nr:flagellar assembly protein FliH [Planctomycetaceae bacterium]
MGTIFRLDDPPRDRRGSGMNFDDLAAEAERFAAAQKIEADRLVTEARKEADSIRQRAAEEGAMAAAQTVERMVAEQLAPSIEALQRAADDLLAARQAWLAHWESSAVRLASAMAARILRGELRRQPEVTLKLVREALELAAGSANVRVRLHPDDLKTLGSEVRAIVDSMSSLGDAELTPDPSITRGGCRVDTRFGTIDQQFESQLHRIEEELIG